MLRLKHDNEFLDITPAADAQVTRNSPLFLLDNPLGEYSAPVSFPDTEKNARHFGFMFFSTAVRQETKLQVERYDGDTFIENTTLVIESAGMNRDFAHKSMLNGYVLVGSSVFYSVIQDKKLTDLKLGGTRNLVYTTGDPFDGSNGWWQQFHDSWNFTQDYVVQPVTNEPDNNPMGFNAMFQGKLAISTYHYLFPKLKYVVEQIFAESGWTADFTGLQDTTWERMILFSATPLKVATVDYTYDSLLHDNIPRFTPFPVLSFTLGSFLPAGYTCDQLIIALCLRYGWAIKPDANARACKFIALRTVPDKTPKDWTRYAGAASTSDMKGTKKTFSFKNDFEGEDGYPSSPSFDGFTIAAPVATLADLPDPNGDYDNTLIFVFQQNQWYKVDLDATNKRIWVTYADNIYDEDVTDSTDTFETKITTMPVFRTLWRTDAGTDYFAYLPYAKQVIGGKTGLRTLLYHGKVYERKDDGTQGTYQYPLASATICLPDGTTEFDWSNVYRHNDGAADHGLIAYWWQRWIDLLSCPEDQVKKRFFLPLHEKLKFEWDDIILDSNVPYLVKQVIEPLNYKENEYIDVVCQRLQTPAGTKVVVVTGMFLKIRFENEQTLPDSEYATDLHVADLWIDAFSDVACTVPAVMNNLTVTIRQAFNGAPFDRPPMVIDGVSSYWYKLAPGFIDYVILHSIFPGNTVPDVYTYSLVPSADYTYVP